MEDMLPYQKEEALTELELTRSLEHRNLVQCLQTFKEGQRQYLMLEYCEKRDLDQFLKTRAGSLLPEEKIWELFSQMCHGLLYLHGRKIFHRDLKLQNIFMTEDDTLKIGDLGISKQMDSTRQTTDTRMIGTPLYLSPEILNNEPYSFKSDIWALGCILY